MFLFKVTLLCKIRYLLVVVVVKVVRVVIVEEVFHLPFYLVWVYAIPFPLLNKKEEII